MGLSLPMVVALASTALASAIQLFAAGIPPTHTLAAQKAKGWLDSARRPVGLLDSQADNADICYTYDQAMAAVAYLALGDTARAGSLLAALQGLQSATGAWSTAFTGNGKAVANQVWIGPIYWVALAAHRHRHATGSARFSAMAEKALLFTLQYRRADGGLTGGEEGGTLLTYVSVEENQDAYAAFKAFGMPAEAEKTRAWLLANAWDAGNSRWRVGPGRDVDFLDVNAWGVQSLGPEGPAEWRKALDYNLARMRLSKTVDGVTVDGFDFNGDKDDVWLEGTAQMAAALKSVDRTTEAEYFIDEMLKAQKADGSLAYSLAGGTTGDGWNMPKVAAVSSTAWLILAIQGINPFHADRDAVGIRFPRSQAKLWTAPRIPCDVLGRLPGLPRGQRP
jgi:hypothetical protein